jgi:hypothetical protein
MMERYKGETLSLMMERDKGETLSLTKERKKIKERPAS